MTSEGFDADEIAEELSGEIGFIPGHGAHTHQEYLLYSSLVPQARLMAGLMMLLGTS